VNKMRTAQADLVQAMDLLTLGSAQRGMSALSRERFDSLLSLDTNTRALKDRIGTLINLSTSLVQIESNSGKLDQATSAMFEDANQLHSIVYSSVGASPQQLAAVDHLRLLSERIHRQGIILLRSPNVTPDTLAQLVSDAKDFRSVLEQLKGGDKRLALPALGGAKDSIQALEDSLAGTDSFVAYVEKHSGNIVAARQGQKALAGLSDAILRDATRLTEQLADATGADRTVQMASVLLLFGAMLSMLILALINIRLARIDAWHETVRNRESQIEAGRAADRNTRNETDMIELMTDISALELGDLTLDYTKNLQAMEGIAGSVRSSVNEGVIALRNAVDMVKAIAGKVLQLVAALVGSTRVLEQSNKKQSSEIDEVVTAVTDLTGNIGRVTEKTLSAARIAEEGKAAAAEGSTVVERAEQAMAQIRTLTQDVLKSVKQSGETSQEILEINDAMESITDRTSIIAMNAEMEAARAGAAGAPIKVLAAEVARLAETSKQLQSTIGALAQRNQGETAATIKLVEDSANAVVQGARLSSQANAELLKIAGLTAKIAEIMSEIEDTAKSQAVNAHTVTERMTALATLSRQFQISVSNVVQSVDQIDKSMGSLKQTVDQFRTDPEAE
jgi:methyl-accepting chemotaxis protein